MFTGIIEEVGTVTAREAQGDSARLHIQGPTVVSDSKRGDSIAVNGVCLTVTDFDGQGGFYTDVMAESLARTTLGELVLGDRVNLERAMRADARLGGHIVQGHVDGTAVLLSRTVHENWQVLRFSLSQHLARYVVEKGSITLSGTSLTVSSVSPIDNDRDASDQWFEVSLIPTTLTDTIFGELPESSAVNIEVDVIAKYVERLLGGRDEQSRS